MKTKAQELNITEFPYVEYDKNGNETYFEDSVGFYSKRKYNDKGNETYFEQSNRYKQYTII